MTTTPLGNLITEERFDEEGRLAFSAVFDYDARGLRTRRTADLDGDGLTDFESRLQRNRAGDVVRTVVRSGDALANELVSMTTYNELGQEVERTEDRGGDRSVEYTSTMHYAGNGRVARVEVDSDDDPAIDLLITNTYDDNDRLIEQTFDGVGIDVHDFLDNRPPPIGLGAIDPFNAQHPYWGREPVLFIADPTALTFRTTSYLRDPRGRVIERRSDSDRDGDGVPEQVAKLVFEGHAVAWYYDAQGDGAFESTASYSYSSAGFLTLVEEQLSQSEDETMVTRTTEPDEHGRRRSIRTASSEPTFEPRKESFSYDVQGRLSETRVSAGEDVDADSTEQTQWENSFRLDDSRLYGMTPYSVGAYQLEYRDVGEPEVRDANGVLIGSYAGGDATLSYQDITVHFTGLADSYLMRIIGANLDATQPEQRGADAVYERDDCRSNVMPLVEAEDDGSAPRIVVSIFDSEVADKSRDTFIADPAARALTKTIGGRYEGARFGCQPLSDTPELTVFPLVPTSLKLAFPLTVEGSDLEIDAFPDLIVN